MPAGHRVNMVYKAINKPLTILGAERKLFFSALIIGGAMFNLFGSLLGALVMFIALLMLGQWVTRRDPQYLRILLNSGKFRKQYDPAKFHDLQIRTIHHA
jgi:type IV secretory pathway TrbD component